MSRDLNDTRQNRRLEQLAKLREAGDDEALAAVLRTEDGRRVLSRLARDFGWMGETWDASLTQVNKAGARASHWISTA